MLTFVSSGLPYVVVFALSSSAIASTPYFPVSITVASRVSILALGLEIVAKAFSIKAMISSLRSFNRDACS